MDRPGEDQGGGNMKIKLDGNPKEIAALVLELQERRGKNVSFVPETSDGPCTGANKVAATASPVDSPTLPCPGTNRTVPSPQ